MSPRISKPQLKAIFHNSIYTSRSALRLHGEQCHTKYPRRIALVHSRPIATKPSNSGHPPSRPDFPRKPSTSTIGRNIAPQATQVQDAQLNSLAQNLVRDGKTVIYQAPSHAAFMGMAWVAGAMCLGGALIILDQRLYEGNKDLPWFVPGAYRIVAVFLISIGGWAVLRPSRLISSIEIMPGNNRARLLFRIRRNLPVPFIKPRRMTVNFSDVSVQRRVVVGPWEPAQRAALSGQPGEGIMKRLANGVSGVFSSLLIGARQFLYYDRIIKLSVKGYGGAWKVDSTGLFSDGGRPFNMIRFEH